MRLGWHRPRLSNVIPWASTFLPQPSQVRASRVHDCPMFKLQHPHLHMVASMTLSPQLVNSVACCRVADPQLGPCPAYRGATLPSARKPKSSRPFLHANSAPPLCDASPQMYLFGACVTSWKQPSGDEVLYVRPDAVFDKSKPISGGVPHCFPQVRHRGGRVGAPGSGAGEVGIAWAQEPGRGRREGVCRTSCCGCSGWY